MTLLNEALAGQPITSCPIVDIHVHLGSWPVLHLPVHDEGLIAKMDRVGVDRICINAALHPDIVEGNNLVVDFMRRHPDRVIGFASLNPIRCDIEEELKRCIDLGCQGIKLHEWVTDHQSRHPLADPRLYGNKWEKIWAMAAEHRLPILYHGVVTEHDIQSFPETIFILAHGTSMLKGEAIKQRFAGYPNFYIDCAASQNTCWECAENLRIFGAERILWGTDAPLLDFAHGLGIIIDLPMREEERRLILGGNALRLLKGPLHESS